MIYGQPFRAYEPGRATGLKVKEPNQGVPAKKLECFPESLDGQASLTANVLSAVSWFFNAMLLSHWKPHGRYSLAPSDAIQ